MSRETRAFRKINRILSKLDPDVAANLARRFMDFYGRPVAAPLSGSDRSAAHPGSDRSAAQREADRAAARQAAARTAARQAANQPAPTPAGQPAGDDDRPSFLRTQYRMEVGKQLMEYLNKEESQDED
jgi:hypothetical protein